LGLLHLEIIRARLEREFNLELIATAPSVVYQVKMEDGTEVEVMNASDFSEGKVAEIREPMTKATILVPSEFIGAVMDLCQSKRGSRDGIVSRSEDRVELFYTLPLREIVFDSFDQLKTPTNGYASLVYAVTGEQAADLVKVNMLPQADHV